MSVKDIETTCRTLHESFPPHQGAPFPVLKLRELIESKILLVQRLAGELNIGLDYRQEVWTLSRAVFFVITTTATIGKQS